MIKEDLKRYGLRRRNLLKSWIIGDSVIAVVRYRIASWLLSHKFRLLPQLISFGTKRKYGCEI
jgi:serine acetyltransferase